MKAFMSTEGSNGRRELEPGGTHDLFACAAAESVALAEARRILAETEPKGFEVRTLGAISAPPLRLSARGLALADALRAWLETSEP